MARGASQAPSRRDDPAGHEETMPARKRWDGTSLHAAYQGSDSGSGTAGSPERGEPSCVTIVDIVLSLLGEPFEK